MWFDPDETASWIASAGLRPSSATTYRQLASNVRGAHVDGVVTVTSLRAWIMAGKAPNTRRSRLTFVRVWAEHTGNPELVPEVTVKGGNVRHGRWLTHEEARKLVGACSPREAALCTVMLLTGLRIAEAVSVRTRDVTDHAILLEGKGGKLAQVPLPDQAHRALETWLLESGVKGLVFDVCVAHVRDLIAAAGYTAGIGHVRPHDLRRTFAGWLDEAGVDLRSIQAALRHSSPATTQRYLESSPTRAARAVRGMEV